MLYDPCSWAEESGQPRPQWGKENLLRAASLALTARGEGVPWKERHYNEQERRLRLGAGSRTGSSKQERNGENLRKGNLIYGYGFCLCFFCCKVWSHLRGIGRLLCTFDEVVWWQLIQGQAKTLELMPNSRVEGIRPQGNVEVNGSRQRPGGPRWAKRGPVV